MLTVWLDLYLAWWEGNSQRPGLRILPHTSGQQEARTHKANAGKSWYPPLVRRSLEENSVHSVVVHFNASGRTMMVVIRPDEKPQKSSVSWHSHYSRPPSHPLSVYTTSLADLLLFPSLSNSYFDCPSWFTPMLVRSLILDCLHDSDLEFP